MLNFKAQPFKPVSVRVRDVRLVERAEPFEPVYRYQQTVFVTFSNGFTLTKSQFLDFFNRTYAPALVERVIVPRPKGGRGQSLHGRVVFKNTVIPVLVMRNHEHVCFSVDGRPFYCKRYFTQKNRTSATASTSLCDVGSHAGGDV